MCECHLMSIDDEEIGKCIDKWMRPMKRIDLSN